MRQQVTDQECGAAVFHPRHSDIMAPIYYCKLPHMHTGKHSMDWEQACDAADRDTIPTRN